MNFVRTGKVKIRRGVFLASPIQNIYLVGLTFKVLKLAYLLSQFLYANKRLDLPGVGTFLLDPSINTDHDNAKPGRAIPEGAISFENNPSIKESPDLVQYISSQTGKIKALAAADLDSHLGLIQQFLNIGKPFQLEGIGNLVKISSGEYAFASGDILPEKIKEFSSKEISATSTSEESFTDYKSVFYGRKEKNINWRKPLVIFLILAGAGLAVWGGYTVYKITTAKNKSAATDKKNKNDIIPVTNTTQYQLDSTAGLVPDQQVNNILPGTYKFILEIANATRAFERFNRLKTFQWNVQMETKDSVSYKLFLLLPALPADTTRLIDSLTMLNGRPVYIGQ